MISVAPIRRFGLAGVAVAACLSVIWAADNPEPTLSAAATDAALRLMTLSQQANGLNDIHLLAHEDWVDEKPSDTTHEIDSVVFYRGVPIEIATSNNGKALSSKAAATENRNAAKVRSNVDHLWSESADAGHLINLDGQVWKLSDFLAQFHWTGMPGPAWEGHNTVRLQFTPISALPSNSRMERILRVSAGEMDLDATSGQLLHGAFHSIATVHYGGGFLGDVQNFDGTFEMQPVDGCWVMKRIQVTVSARELFHRINGTETMTYSPVAALR